MARWRFRRGTWRGRARRCPLTARAELWVAVFDVDGEFMGAAPATARPAWEWRAGRLSLNYAPVIVPVRFGGWYKTGVICAVIPSARAYRPMWPVSLGEPQRLRPGNTITITDGLIAIDTVDPELAGGVNLGRRRGV